jgi:hypothetical protein
MLNAMKNRLLTLAALAGLGGSALFALLAHRYVARWRETTAELEKALDAQRRSQAHARSVEPPVSAVVVAPPKELPDRFSRELLRACISADETARWEALQRLGLKFSNEDFRDIVSGLTNNDYRVAQESQKIIELWSRHDPAAAMAWVKTLASNPERYLQAMGVVLPAWSRRDPTAAADWLLAQPAGARKEAMALQAMDGIAAGNTPKALALYAQMDEVQRGYLSGHLAAGWATKDLAAATAWASQLPESRARENALQQVAVQMAKTDPQGALKLVEGLQSEAVRGNVFPSIAREWAARDPAAAGQWLKGLPEGRAKDYTLMQYSAELVRTRPAEAAQWGELVQDRTLANSALYSIACQWLDLDRPAAIQWILASKLPENVKQTLTNRPTATPPGPP